LGPIEPAAVFQYSVEPPFGHIVADPLDHLTRAEGFAKGRDRPRPPLRTHDVPPRAQLVPQRGDRPLGVVAGAVDPADSQRHSGSSAIGRPPDTASSSQPCPTNNLPGGSAAMATAP